MYQQQTCDDGVYDAGFEGIANDLYEKGYAISDLALPRALAEQLRLQVINSGSDKFHRAGIGREKHHAINDSVRTDEICWITGNSCAGQAWLDWTTNLKDYLNRRLFLGLFSFESHFAHYGPGDYYKMHLDAFKGEANRVLTLVAYLNPDWKPEYGGQLVIQTGKGEQNKRFVSPTFARLVVFLSEDFPHEVLPATRDRYSIAGWFRLNTSQSNRVDPAT